MLCLGIHAFQNVVKFHDQYIKRKNYDFSRLPPHILVQILAQLRLSDFKSAVLTCQSWYYASWDTRITNKWCIGIPPYDAVEPDFLIRPITNLLMQSTNHKYKRLLRKYNYSIREVEVRCQSISVAKIFELFVYLSNVKKVKIFSGSKDYSPKNFNSCKILQKNWDTIIRNMSKITSLAIQSRYKDLTAYGSFIGYCCNLESLYWNEYDLSGYEHSPFVYNYLLNPEKNVSLNTITDLLIHSVDRKQNSKFFEKMIKLELRNLRKLSIMEISLTYYDVIFKEFCKSYNYLEGLSISACNEQQLSDICKYMTRLKTIELYPTNANNLSELRHLKELECLIVDRVDVVRDDDIIYLFDSRFQHLRKLTFNHISAAILQKICENHRNLVELHLSFCDTKDCEPIFRNLHKLKKLYLSFTELPTMHSSRFRNSDEWNITKLVDLEDLYFSCYVPGIIPEFIERLTKLKTDCMDHIYDPTEEDIRLQNQILENVEVEPEIEAVVEEIDFGSDLNFMYAN